MTPCWEGTVLGGLRWPATRAVRALIGIGLGCVAAAWDEV